MNSGSTSSEEILDLPRANPVLRALAFWADAALFSVCQFLFLIVGGWLFGRGLSWNGFCIACLLVGVALPLVYLCWANAGGRQSPGARLAGVQIVDLKGRPLNLFSNGLRTVFTWIFGSYCCFWIAFLPIVFPGNRTLADYLVRSKVVRKSEPRVPQLIAGALLQFFLLGLLSVGIQREIFPVQAFYIPSGAMEPTLQINDRLLANRLTYRSRDPLDGEVVIFQAPMAALATSGTTTPQTFVKRCVGVPGEVVEMRRTRLFRNGTPIDEPNVIWKDPAPAGMPFPLYMYDMKIVDGEVYSREYLGPTEPGEWTRGGIIVATADQKAISAARPGKVPDGMFLVLGDHRNNSNDSHVWGFVPRNLIQARAMGIFWPLSRWGAL